MGSGKGQFNHPWGIAIHEASGRLYVADNNNHRVQQFDLEGNFINQFGGGWIFGAKFNNPCGLCVHQKTGNVLIADSLNHRVVVMNSKGSTLFTIGGTRGNQDGQLGYPLNVCVMESSGNIVVADSY